ncbi:MAG: hypothetical protein ACYTG2_13970 [Planctomycetota bacterium]
MSHKSHEEPGVLENGRPQPGVAAAPRSRRAAPLSADEMQVVERAGRRIHAELRQMLGALPSEIRNASRLARSLAVDRTACQRLIHSVGGPYPGPEMLGGLPGLRTLRRIVGAVRSLDSSPPESLLEEVESAIDHLESVIGHIAGSQAQLVRRLAATARLPTLGGDPPSDTVPIRQQLFDIAARLTGRYSEAWASVFLYWPDAARESLMHQARAYGLVGHVVGASAVPLTFLNFAYKESKHGEQGERSFRPLVEPSQDDGVPAAILRRFTTSPVPVVSTTQPHEFEVASVEDDPEAMASGASRPLDVFLGSRAVTEHPRCRDVPVTEVWGLINFPVRQLLLDVYLHRDLARQCIPSLDVHLWRPDFDHGVGDRWSTRFSSGPRLQLLGQGIRGADSEAYARHAELTAFVFEKAGCRPSDFVGFRCEEAYPIWRCGYCIGFDFSGSGAR